MAKATVYDLNRRKKGEVDLPDDIFGADVNEHVLHEVVRMQRAGQRKGTACTKERNAVSGGGAKPYRQKGTGRARQGSIRAPNHVGGGTVFGPKPRSYGFRPPRSVRRKALISALSLYNRDDRIVVLSGFDLKEPKTQKFVNVMGKFKAGSGVVVDRAGNDNLSLSVRNARGYVYLPPAGLNVLDILNHEMLFITEEGLAGIASRFQASRTEEG
jgi:large subunit ribosomal protein L4